MLSKWVMRLCTVSMLSSACTTRQASQQRAENELTMLAGTYTSGSSKGIYTFRFDQETGMSTPLSETEVSNPSYLTVSSDNRYVYAVSEENNTAAAVNAFAFDREKGTLRLLNRQKTMGEGPCYVSTNGKKVLTANYSGGSMTVFSIRYDGSLEPSDTLFQGSASGPDTERQATPHIHCAIFSPDSNYIFATDFSADRILRYAVNRKEELPRPLSEMVTLPPGSGPRHLIFSKDGNYAYLITELSGKVIAFTYANGKLNAIQTITADTVQAKGSADIHLSPDGKYLYTTNRLKEDGIAIFEVNPENGMLAKVGYQLTDPHPRHFNITPNGKYLLVACRDSNTIQVFRRDVKSGLLQTTGQDIKIDQPVCIQFAVKQ